MYITMYMCVHVRTMRLHICIYTHVHILSLSHLYMHAHTHTNTYTYSYTYTRTHARIYAHTHAQNYTLVDFYPSNEAVWGVWLREGEGEEGSTLVQSARYNGERPSSWKKSSLVSHPPQEIAIPPFKDPRVKESIGLLVRCTFEPIFVYSGVHVGCML